MQAKKPNPGENGEPKGQLGGHVSVQAEGSRVRLFHGGGCPGVRSTNSLRCPW